ncbi:maltose permease [Punctularia strigosozonata HHB-11173 SS5]|uniref:Maltose permease n=1 Tax=Punctularia strigosozonata (strain HHB-11173) TaxID=741275 RepID=R7S1Q1_PUNST|nr:maltose permease [Punctularia strigosozonata HHB-11173 SS5]EIN04153.1 maltose permease [Punctularia strigosozonata HHB-11173 SS5]
MSEYGMHEAPADVVVANNDELVRKLDANVIADAAKADAQEHKMTVREAFIIHRRAIFWSMALSAALIMEGYDVVVIASFYGQPNFLKRFGVPAPNTDAGYVIPAEWQSALSNGSSAGGIIGLLVNGWAADRFGPKIVMMCSIVALTGFIFIMVFAKSLTMLVIGEVFCGIPWGVFQTLTTAYASEVCPIQLRGYLTTYVNLCWGVGILLSSGVVKATLNINSDWSWRLPFIIQWVWIVPLFLIVYFCPPSPWWLVRKGRLDEAEQSIMRLTNPAVYTSDQAKSTVAMMVHTNELEKQAAAGTTYFDCFKGTDRRRTEVVMMVFAMQLLSGENLIGQGVQFLQTAGISTSLSFSLNMVLNSMFIIGTIISWGLITWFGRRTLYTAGMAIMAVVLFIIGGLGFIGTNSSTMAIGSLLIALNFIYNSTLGPICYTLIGEISSTRLRQKSIVLSRISYQIMNIVCGIIVPRMLSPTSWNWGPKSGFFWAGSATLSTLYCFLRLPETKGRSYGELDLLFESKTPAWRFKSTKVDQFGTHHHGSVHPDTKEEIHHLE